MTACTGLFIFSEQLCLHLGVLGQNQIPIQGNLHGTDRTDRYTQTTAGAFLCIKLNPHLRPFYKEGTHRTDPGTGSTLITLLIIPANPGSQPLNLDSECSQEIQPCLHARFRTTCQLKDHNPFPLQEDVGLQDIKLEIIFLYQLIHKRLITGIFREAQYVNLGVHDVILFCRYQI